MSDEIWYYADRQRQKQGPVSAEAIAALFAQGAVDASTLVWRDGLADWQALAQHAAALGIDNNELHRADARSTDPSPPPMPSSQDRAASTSPVYAGFWRRFAALIIDRLLISAVLIVIGVVVAVAMMAVAPAHAESDSAGANAGFIFEGILWFGYLLIAPFYFALQESSVHQATLGKRALGIKVTTLDGRRLTVAHALGRWAAAAVSYFTFYIGFLMAAFTERKQALHDLMVGTLVVDRWAFTEQPEKQQQGTSGCLLALIIGTFAFVPILGILAAIAIPQYQLYVIRAQANEGLYIAEALKPAVANAYAELGRCPTNADAGFRPPDAYAGSYVVSATVGALDNGDCAIEVRFGGAKANRAIAESSLRFEAAPGADGFHWTCGSVNLEDQYLPRACRSGN